MRDPDALLARAGVTGNPDRDQHFLVDDRVLDRLPGYLGDATADESVTEPAVPSVEHVLEVGAGTGGLTDRLLAAFDQVTAIERDPHLADFLCEEFADPVTSDRLTVIEGDATEVDLPDFDASVSNLPYGASSEILFELLPAGRPLVVMVQSEFAERLVAEPDTPEYGRLSVTAGHYADAEIVEPVPPTAFSPPPAVESAVVRTTPHVPDYASAPGDRPPGRESQSGTPASQVPDEFFLRFVKALFTQRRKTTRNAIRNTAHISGLDDPDAAVGAAEEDLLSARPGALAPAAFADLAAVAWEQGVA